MMAEIFWGAAFAAERGQRDRQLGQAHPGHFHAELGECWQCRNRSHGSQNAAA
jgi:hypothetical protein